MTDFREWLTEIAATALVVDESHDGLQCEAQGNLWSFSFAQAQDQTLMSEDVAASLDAVVNIYNDRLLHPNCVSRMVFYCWFDHQASQLRFSLVSASHGSLPFSCPVEVVNNSVQIVEQFRNSPYYDGIPLNEFSEQNGSNLGQVENSALQVWAKELPIYLPQSIGLAEGELVVPDDFDAPLPDEILWDSEG